VLAATTTAVTASANPVPADESFTLTSKVKETYGSPVPTGSMTFSSGTTMLGTVTLDDTGAASLNESTLGYAAGAYTITATYSGDSLNASSSATVQETVE
jgi:hypothetical protein